jgi:uncharacterized phiE125 gp8 family phage protein
VTFLDGRINNYQDETRFAIVTDVADEPVTTDELKAHLRVDFGDDDSLIADLGVAARRLVEAFTGRRLMPRVEKLLLDRFPPVKELLIPAAPISSIDSITYFDQEGVGTVFSSSYYVTDTRGPIGLVALKYGVIWPILGSLRRPVNAVEVQFHSGYADADAVPSELKLAVKLLTGHLYENREATTPITVNELPMGLKSLLTPHRLWEGLL